MDIDQGDDRLVHLGVDSSSDGAKSDPVKRKKILASIGASSETGEETESKHAFARDPRDFSGKRPGEEGYNPKQLKIPPDAYAKLSAAKKQYWDYKREHFDEIVFFQQGDFFNLFASDADIGLEKFGLLYNKMLDSVGFNRKQLNDWATKFANMGYKVTVLEQDSTATSEEDKKKKSAATMKSKGTEDRSVTNKVTSGTVSDFEMFDASSSRDSQARYLLVIAESTNPTSDCSNYGVSFIDTSTYEWGITFFTDDSRSSQLETLLLRLRPREVLFERNGLSKKTKKLLDINLTSPCLSFLSKFPDTASTQILLSDYFTLSQEAQSSNAMDTDQSSRPALPEVLFKIISSAVQRSSNDTNESSSSSDFIVTESTAKYLSGLSSATLAVSSVGAAITYFKDLTRTVTSSSGASDEPRVISAVDAELVQRARFRLYSVHADPTQATMVLDAVALSNLEILENNDDGTERGTLISVLDHCASSFGKRRLKQWLCHPLRRIDQLIERQSIVRFFFDRPPLLESSRATLGKVKDLERLITRAEAKNITLGLFLDLLDSLDIISRYINVLKNHTKDYRVYSPIDRYCDEGFRLSQAQLSSSQASSSQSIPNHIEEDLIPAPLRMILDEFPDLGPMSAFYGFDRIAARRDGMLIPLPGTNSAFDDAQAAVAMARAKLETQLAKYKSELSDSSISYHFSKTENYSVVVTKSSTKIPSTWTNSKAKAGNRYWAPESTALAEELAEAESDLQRASVGALMACLDAFVIRFASDCSKAISHAADLDVLMSLARYSCNAASESDVCLPEFFDLTSPTTDPSHALPSPLQSHIHASHRTASKPFLDIATMKHPFVTPARGGRFIPNSVNLGSHPDSPAILLVTGPNMGGKSTLLRQVCILTIMAQLGCYVPAERCRLTPVDRIFTRIGARDNLIAGQSTFMVELEETAKILAQATSNSLVILDELGRGTSTFDGYSLAFAVLKHFESQNNRVLFSTHYHKLTQEFNSEADAVKVQQGHMACKEEGGVMTFLYQLSLGPCPNSFGLEVAGMARIPHEILERASTMSDMFEVLADKKATNVKVINFVRLLRLLKQNANKAKAGGGSSNNGHSSSSSSSLSNNTAHDFLKAEVSRLWRQLRFIDSQRQIAE
jgi:DNA mismatch repair protein MSH6